MAEQAKKQQPARRDFIKKAAYVAPAILTLAASPAYATVGSAKPVGPQHERKPKKPGK